MIDHHDGRSSAVPASVPAWLPEAPSAPQRTDNAPAGGLLSMLSCDEQHLLRTHLVPVVFAPDTPLEPVGPGDPGCYFVESGLIAVITRVGAEQRPIEVGLVGAGGMVGVWVLLGIDSAPHVGTALTTVEALRIDALVLRQLAAANDRLRHMLLRYAYARVAELMRISGCNACHTLDQRLARWLLTASVRLGDQTIHVTHHRIAMLLGVRRAGVTLGLHTLEGSGAIRSRRGHIEIRDRARLEAFSCGCDIAVNSPPSSAVIVDPVPGRQSDAVA